MNSRCLKTLQFTGNYYYPPVVPPPPLINDYSMLNYNILLLIGFSTMNPINLHAIFAPKIKLTFQILEFSHFASNI